MRKLFPIPFFSFRRPSLRRAGFTLVELLVVVAITGLLIFLSMPSLVSLMGNRSQSAANEISDMLEQARAYAMGNSTHVFVGIAEYDVSQPSSAAPQTKGVGRVVIATVASRDCTSQYDVINSSWTGKSSTLVPISKPRVFDNLHLADYTPHPDSQTPPMTSKGPMMRPVYTPNYGVGNAKFTSSTPFNYPLAGKTRYHFDKVINFDARGVARNIHFARKNTDVIPATLEIDLQVMRGTAVPSPPSDASPINYIAVQCDGMTGTTRVFR